MRRINFGRVVLGGIVAGGPRTAAFAGLAVWIAGVLLPNVGFMGLMGLFPASLTAMTTAAGVVESVIAAMVGAALYQEVAGPARTMHARV
jgi:hypothetical protein